MLLVLVSCVLLVSAISMASADRKTVSALHLVAHGVSVDDVKHRVDLASISGFNTLIVQLADGVAFDSYPGVLRNDAWSVAELLDLISYARLKGMEVIPEIKLLTHQEKFFQSQLLTLMFNRSTYDPRKPEVYEVVLPYLDEIIDLLQPTAIHIGHDEVAGHNSGSKKKWLRTGEQMLPSDLFLKDVERIHAHLKKRSVETWMWGDMLISPDEFPNMLAQHLHGTVPGYGKALRNKLPKDIVICDWHYFDEQTEFPSLATFKAEGFRVLGATWKKPETIRNFSRYAKRHGADGMIATTWFHVQRMEWGIVEQIIRESGEAFLRAQ